MLVISEFKSDDGMALDFSKVIFSHMVSCVCTFESKSGHCQYRGSLHHPPECLFELYNQSYMPKPTIHVAHIQQQTPQVIMK